ncbi:hypothetical protein CXB51_033397 [Gossypium anomalum]|uniref:Uncharacterized protein n=1 Tax=Gossypium anomalum TaxID=47600 RepID=A0A8J6CN76_9ROSI|nr:hypothetical protein CXB51_033397 [Gossypium anomalum]
MCNNISWYRSCQVTLEVECKMESFEVILKPICLVILIVLCLHAMPSSCNFTSFVFGDSLVDAGNNDYIFTLSKADSPPYGIDFTPSGGQPTGRFTNGRTIADIVGQSLGAKSFPPPYLAPNTEAQAILRGINYASGASGIMDKTGFFFRLHEMGARKFIVVGVGPLGCIPFVRALKLLRSGQCSSAVNTLIQAYNQRLKELLSRLNQEMGPETIFVFANSYNVFMDIIANYHQYGLENANDPCCGGYFPPFVCFKSSDANTSALCDDRSKYVFWDAYHPTEAANLIIAKQLVDGDESVSFPINIRKLYTYNNS